MAGRKEGDRMRTRAPQIMQTLMHKTKTIEESFSFLLIESMKALTFSLHNPRRRQHMSIKSVNAIRTYCVLSSDANTTTSSSTTAEADFTRAICAQNICTLMIQVHVSTRRKNIQTGHDAKCTTGAIKIKCPFSENVARNKTPHMVIYFWSHRYDTPVW